MKKGQGVFERRVGRMLEEKKRLRESLKEAKKENRSLQKELRLSRKLLDEMPGGVILVQEEKIVYVNEKSRARIGYAEREILGRHFMEFVHPDSAGFLRKLHKRRLAGKSAPDRYEIHLLTRERTKICCEVRVNKARYNGRRAFLLNTVGVDHRKDHERQVLRSQKREALERVFLALDREWRRCIRELEGGIDALKGLPSVDRPALKKVEEARERAVRMRRRLHGLLRKRHARSERLPFDLRKIVREAVAGVRSTLEGEGEKAQKIHVKTYLRTLSPVEGNPDEMREVLVSLLLNAAEALPNGGEIYLTTEESAGFASVYVQDSGKGVPADIQERIFDPFFTTKDGVRAGLGLSLAEAAVARHGGEMEVMAREGEGTVFTIKLPLAQESRKQKMRSALKQLKESHLLIVTDEDLVRDLLSRLFLSKGAKVTTASTGMEGLKILKKNKIQALIADLDTPDLKSGKLIPSFKKSNKELLVGAILPHGQAGAARLLKGGAADLLIGRPLDLTQILRSVSEAIAYKDVA